MKCERCSRKSGGISITKLNRPDGFFILKVRRSNTGPQGRASDAGVKALRSPQTETLYDVTTLEHKPAQRQFVHRRIDWERVRCRCKCYSAIGRTFPLETLKKGCESPPYYCHYMAWRLGTWPDAVKCLFQRLEELLCCAERLPKWQHEKSLLRSADFAAFWSLVWQLQVAEHLCEVGKDVRWAKSGPDLSVKVNGERWFVECYTYRKSFGLLEFLNELLDNINPAICTDYDRCFPFQLPQGSGRTEFLDEILSLFLDPAYLTNAKERAKQKSPVVLYKHPNSSLCVYVEGDGVDGRDVLPKKTGSPEKYLKVVLQEAIRAKRNRNALKKHHPNLLAVNYLLSIDYHLARSSRETLTLPEIEPNIDVLAVSAVGIDKQLSREKLAVVRGGRSARVNRKNLNRIARVNDELQH